MNHLLRLVIFLATALAVNPAVREHCECGRSAAQSITYEPPVAEGAYPDPEVARVSRSSHAHLITIQVGIPARKHEVYPMLRVELVSSNEGLTWSGKSNTADLRRRSPANSSILYKYDSRSRFFRSVDGGAHWERPAFHIAGQTTEAYARGLFRDKRAERVFHLLALHPRNAMTLYGTFKFDVFSAVGAKRFERTYDLPGIYVSVDGGNEWSLFSSNLRADSPVGISDTNPDVMMALAPNSVVKTVDGGKHWALVGQETELLKPAEQRGLAEALEKIEKIPGLLKRPPDAFSYLNLSIRQIAFEPGSSTTIYLVTNKGLYRTTNGGDSWCLLDIGIDKIDYIKSIFFEPEHPDVFYLGTEDKIVRSENWGCNFTAIFDWSKLTKSIPKLAHK